MRVRRLEIVVLAAAAVFVAVLAVSFRPGRRPSSGERRERIPPAPSLDAVGQPTTLLDGFDFTETQAGKPLLRIKADRTIGYGPAAGLAPNLYAGERVTLTVYPDDGSPVTVHAERADYDERSRESRLSGNVRWVDDENSLAETDRVLFHPSARTLEAPGRVHFTRGSIDLTASSALYDVRERVLHLRGPIEGSGGGEDSGGLSHLTAREGLYRRELGVIELESAQGESKTGDRFAADHLVVKMGPAGGHPEWARGTGNVRGILSSERRLGGERAPPASARQYAGETSVLSFDGEGRARAFSLTGSPASISESERRVQAKQIDIAFVEGRASAAAASGEVRIESKGQRAAAEKGSLGFGPDGQTENVSLEGGVQIEGDGRNGQAQRAVQVGARHTWVLTGDSARAAKIDDGRSRLSADRIEIEEEEKRIRGEGRARAVFVQDPKSADAEKRVTFVGDSKRPTYGKADRIVLDDVRKLATLSGAATLWQDASSLSADDITLSDNDKTVTAVQNVRALMVPDPEHPAKNPERVTSLITAKRMLYREGDRTARFEGGVAMTRGGLHATGGESTAWLGKERNVECVEITGNVALADRAAGRSGTAEKALDYPGQGKTMLWGSPARVTEAAGNQVAGAVLTMTDRGRSVEITAPEGGKTETIHKTTND